MAFIAPLLVGTAATAATATTAAAAATAGLFGTAGAVTLGGILSGAGLVSSLFAAGSSASNMSSAYLSQAMDFSSQSRGLQLQAYSQDVQGKQEAVDTRSRMLRTLAAQRASYAARGIQLGGSPETVAEDTLSQDRAQTGAALYNASTKSTASAIEAGLAKNKARVSVTQAREARKQGLATQAGIGMSFLGNAAAAGRLGGIS